MPVQCNVGFFEKSLMRYWWMLDLGLYNTITSCFSLEGRKPVNQLFGSFPHWVMWTLKSVWL